MNWTTLLRFRKQVEDVIREEVLMAEFEKTQEESKQEGIREEMNHIAIELDRSLRDGVEVVFAEQRFRWLEETGGILEHRATRLQEVQQKLGQLRNRLQQAYHARRVVEIVIEKKEAAYVKKVAKQEQILIDEITAHKKVMAQQEEVR